MCGVPPPNAVQREGHRLALLASREAFLFFLFLFPLQQHRICISSQVSRYTYVRYTRRLTRWMDGCRDVSRNGWMGVEMSQERPTTTLEDLLLRATLLLVFCHTLYALLEYALVEAMAFAYVLCCTALHCNYLPAC